MHIFEIEENVLKINENCLLIPELRAVNEAYEDPIPAFAFCHYMTSPDSPYHNIPKGEKELYILDDVKGDFNTNDDVILAAIAKLQKLYETPIQQLYEGAKNSLHVIGQYLGNLTEGSIKHGMHGNLSDIFRMQKEMGKVAEQFLKVEKLWTEQVQQKLRGNAELGEY